MPFNRSPTISSRNIERPRPPPRRTTETNSPPHRSNTTRKVNVVSKASLAMLNPAYAMGIEAGPSWYEEQERLRSQASPSPILSPSGSLSAESPWATDSTPELEAFMTEEETHQYQEEGCLGLILGAPAMQRKVSSESVFEDDESPASSKGPTVNTSGSSSLSRFFTWKKPAKGKPSGPYSSWDVPQSAPSHIQSFFDLPGYEFSSPIEASHSLPATPADVLIAPLPSPTTRNITMSRKSSMPTLRDIRRATGGSPLTVEVPFPKISPAASTDSFYWRSESPRTPTFFSPSNSNSSNLSIKSTARNNSRISSMGRGAARKSSVESTIIPSILVKPPPKKKQQQRCDRNFPPIPSHPSVASLIAEERQQQQSNSLPSGNTRRRSKSVDALPIGFSSAPTMKRTQSSQSQVTQAVRINVTSSNHHGVVVGTASPKLLAKTSPVFFNNQSPQQNKKLLQVVESPVVVNVMPPTPDLGSIDQGTFEGASASPSVHRSRSENEIAHLIEGHETILSSKSNELENEEDSDEESFLPYATGERFDDYDHNQSENSVSESPISAVSQAMDNEDEDPFGFARSLSTMSLSSEASMDSEMSEEGAASLESAKILSASSTMSSFSRALLVSPRLGESSSWGSHSGLSSSSGDTSMTSLASSTFSSSSFSSSVNKNKRSSKRLSGLPSPSSCQSLASLMTISSSILDYGAEYIFPNDQTSNLSSPVELQGQQMEGEDCLTPRLSDGFHATNTTKPLVVRKANQGQSIQSDYQQGILSPISPRPYPRAHNATSPHLELDLSLPLDLHEIGLGFGIDEVPKRREKPRVPNKSRARHAAPSAEPKTPPTTTRLLSSVMREERENDTLGLGLGLGLGSTFSNQLVEEDGISQWRRHQHIKSTNVDVSMGMAL